MISAVDTGPREQGGAWEVESDHAGSVAGRRASIKRVACDELSDAGGDGESWQAGRWTLADGSMRLEGGPTLRGQDDMRARDSSTS